MNMEIQAALDVADETDAFLQITDVIYDKESEAGYDELTAAEQTVYCIDSLLREMENGGFAQFFHHDSGANAADTMEALERIRSSQVLAVFHKVVNFFPDGEVPQDEDDRISQFDQIESELTDEIAACDDKFYDADENLVELTLQYVSKNLKAFRG